jgi:4-aminobutyrate aminotransferase-like enzyme
MIERCRARDRRGGPGNRFRPLEYTAREAADRIMNLLREDGILVARTGVFNNVVKIRPPLVFTPDNARMLLEGLNRALARV